MTIPFFYEIHTVRYPRTIGRIERPRARTILGRVEYIKYILERQGWRQRSEDWSHETLICPSVFFGQNPHLFRSEPTLSSVRTHTLGDRRPIPFGQNPHQSSAKAPSQQHRRVGASPVIGLSVGAPLLETLDCVAVSFDDNLVALAIGHDLAQGAREGCCTSRCGRFDTAALFRGERLENAAGL